tara:strand:+ start:97 stop:633 length:537 start_codon:yes stop_codon:yes gene_type:complete
MAKKNMFTTPKGVAQYPWLNVADTHYDSNGKYKCNLRVKVADAQDLMKQIKEAAKAEFGDKAATARMPFKADEEKGEIIFSAGSKYQPRFVDSAGQLIDEKAAPQIYGGSVLKMAGSLYCYNNGSNTGVSLQLSGVQIIELVAAKNNMFDAVEEGGFVASNDNRVHTGDGDAEVQYNF